MTKARARDLCIVVWSYLKEFPSIKAKKNLPPALYAKIRTLRYQCPLCHVFFHQTGDILTCDGCPLDGNCVHGEKVYSKWTDAKTDKVRSAAAGRLLDIILAWEPKKDSK